jgi:stage V sporulation protein SpoVS
MRALPIIATIETGDLLNARPGEQIQGKVIFTEAVRGVIGEAVVRSAPGAVALARLDWVPQGTATFSVTAAFVPTVAQSTGTVSYAASTSEPSAFTVGVDRKRVQLLMPQTVHVGVPAFVAVNVDEDRRGSVSITVDGRAISPDKPVEGGMVEFLWTPLRKGVADVEVIFHELGVDDARRDSTSDGVRTDIERLDLSRVVDQEINVQAQRRPNPISVTPVVDGIAGSPWQNRGVLRYPAGSRVWLVMSTGTGTAVNLEVLGTCLLSGNSLFMPATGGGCVVRFSAPGGPNNSSNEAEVLITVPVGSGTLADTEKNLQGILKSGVFG